METDDEYQKQKPTTEKYLMDTTAAPTTITPDGKPAGARPNFKQSVDTLALIKILIPTTVGDLVTYDTCTEAIGRDVRNGARGVLMSARKFVRREHGMVFGAVTNEGVKRLSDVEIIQTGSDAVKRINRAAKRAAETITLVDFDKLPGEQQIEQQTHLSLLSAFATIAKPAGIRRVRAHVTETKAALPLAMVLDALKE